MKTDNLALVAAFRIHGIYPESIGQRDDGRAVFVFERTPEVAAKALEFYGDELTVPARAFATTFAAIKRELVTQGAN